MERKIRWFPENHDALHYSSSRHTSTHSSNLLSLPLAWFTSQSFYPPNFIFHLTSLILFVNKAPLPCSISSQKTIFFSLHPILDICRGSRDGKNLSRRLEKVFAGNWQVSSRGERRTSRKLWQSRKLKRQTWVERWTTKKVTFNILDDRKAKLNFHWINSITKWKIIFSSLHSFRSVSSTEIFTCS